MSSIFFVYMGVQSFSKLGGSIPRGCMYLLSFLKAPRSEQNSFSCLIMPQKLSFRYAQIASMLTYFSSQDTVLISFLSLGGCPKDKRRNFFTEAEENHMVLDCILFLTIKPVRVHCWTSHKNSFHNSKWKLLPNLTWMWHTGILFCTQHPYLPLYAQAVRMHSQRWRPCVATALHQCLTLPSGKVLTLHWHNGPVARLYSYLVSFR